MRQIQVLATVMAAIVVTACGSGVSVDSAASAGAQTPALPDASNHGNSIDSGDASFTVSWTPPTRNTDGTALTDLAGYEIHVGLHSGRYTKRIVLNGIGLSRYVVSGVARDTYFVAMRARNRSGRLSDFSDEAALMSD